MSIASVKVNRPVPVPPPATVEVTLTMSEEQAKEWAYVIGYRMAGSIDSPFGSVLHDLFGALSDAGFNGSGINGRDKFTGNIKRVE